MSNEPTEQRIHDASPPVNRWAMVPLPPQTIQFKDRKIVLGFKTSVITDEGANHDLVELENVTYSLPRQGDCNILLQVYDGPKTIPLAVASMTSSDRTASLNMVQKVKACKKNESAPDEAIQIATYPEIEHPYREILYGKDKVKWQELLIESSCSTAKASGCDEIIVVSAFSNRHLNFGRGILLPFGIQQYDQILNKMEGFVPIDSDGRQIEGDNRKTLGVIMRKLRDKDLKSLEEVHAFYPNFKLPVFWKKAL